MTKTSSIPDFLIIGSGISGLSFALKAAEFGEVLLVTKKGSMDTATNLAQGGIAAVLSAEDRFEDHIADTLRSGAGLCHREVVEMVVRDGPARIAELQRIGVRFSRTASGELDLGREGGHSARRIVHAHDLTGREIERGLLAAVAAAPRITVRENVVAVDLLVGSKAGVAPEEKGRGDVCLGAYLLDRQTGEVESCRARITVLCTGGSGKVYLYTSNPDIATGDGVAMAFRAGARIANLEFVQFHPTCLFHPRVKTFLISEAVRGEGGRLVDERGVPFMRKYDPRGDLATRDTVARAIDAEMKASGDDCVYLDISHKPAAFVKKRFPNIYQTCLRLGIDITREPIPVVPAAHYQCGGVVVDRDGHSSLENLYVLGETAHTGLHGANRLASNSLLEAVVYAHRAAGDCRRRIAKVRRRPEVEVAAWSSGRADRLEECVLISHNWDQIRRLMWNYVGIVRRRRRLELVEQRLAPVVEEVRQHFHDYLLTPDLVELRNIALLATLIVRCALSRRESRGLHYMVDYPHSDPSLCRDTVLDKSALYPL